ncbi:MAG: IS1380 family transposase [Actinobacteria bacterium]|nr:IS1380 family transposase [Actinomycetota bacterium]
MGAPKNGGLRLLFDRRLRLEFRGARITTDAGLLAVRELDEMMGLTDMAGESIADKRTGKNIQHQIPGLLRQSVYARLAGYEDTNDHEGLSLDPAMRAVIGKRALDRTAASSGTVSRFETEILTQDENIDALSSLNSTWVSKAVSLSKAKKVILDIDSSESPVHGSQEGSAYNGHFESTCYHPLFCFNNFGDCEGAVLRPGNVHSADGWREFLSPIVDKYKEMDKKLYLRGDAAFAIPDIYEYLEDKGVLYAIRLKANNNLHREIDHLMTRPVGRPSKKPKVFFHDFSYRAASWKSSRRVIAKVEWHAGELFPRTGFIVTNMSRTPENVVRFYNRRGNCERWIKEGKSALTWTRLSCAKYVSNQVRFALFVLAYNLGNFLRRFALPSEVSHWSLSSIQLKLIKIGAKIISHSRMTVFQLCEASHNWNNVECSLMLRSLLFFLQSRGFRD